ncbi:hypothetical protein SO802_029992 [Lithocarpus litseifolius]|uniref:RNase H type-1 domain-containing protein n=1 Tax=Lithocarpus litseifolius TaxID=425828 RepID=A0AAW2BVR4_9ROSI
MRHDTSHENISAAPQAVGVSIGQSSGQVSHELIVSKPEPSQAVNLPIEFVPAVLPETSDVGPSSLKKRRKNKKKPNKKLRSDTPCVGIDMGMGTILVANCRLSYDSSPNNSSSTLFGSPVKKLALLCIWKSVPHCVAIFLSALCLKMENAFMVVSVSAIHDIQYTQVLVAYAGIGKDCQGQMKRKWVNANGRMNKCLIDGKPTWSMIFPFAVWNVWKSRNNFVFKGKIHNPRLATEIISQTEEFLYCVYSPRGLTRNVIKRIRWERPPEGWAKLNTDGALIGLSGLAGCGGLVRDDRGEWIAGFSRRIGATNSFMAELWGLIRDGLILCCNLHLSSLIVELDAKAVVDAFLHLNYENNVISPILDDCGQLVTQFHQIQFKHCYRQANRCVDVLARRGAEQGFDFIPEDIMNVFEDDLFGMYFNRLCPESDVMF